MSRVASPWPEETYESPTVDRDLLAGLEDAVATITSLHEAYLVTRRSVHHGREKVQLGIVAHVGGRWRSRRRIAALSDALRPFFPDRLQWASPGNSAVPDEARLMGIRLKGHC
jgi:hypothetical protein